MLLYGDLVFHVLAHVQPKKPQAASVYDPAYVEYCESHLGPIAKRELGEDVRALSELLFSHEKLAFVQLLAWLFTSADDAAACDGRKISEIQKDPACGDVLSRLTSSDQTSIELLRCAVALERKYWENLPPTHASHEMERLLQALQGVAPFLQRVTVRQARALGRRGRAFNKSIFVGCPGAEPFAPSHEHAALQAAHEASVLEIQSVAHLPFRELEHAALALFRTRIRKSAFEPIHDVWLRSHQLDDFGGIDQIALVGLREETRALVEKLPHVRGAHL